MSWLHFPTLVVKFNAHLRKTTLTGFLLLIPLVMTFFILRFLFNVVNGILQPIVEPFIRDFIEGRFGLDLPILPGLGLIALLILIYIAGVFGGNVLARRVINRVQNTLNRTPIAGTVYSAARQLFESFGATTNGGSGRNSVKKVVVIEYPRPRAWSIGFLTGSTEDSNRRAYGVVYIPTAPMPNSGWVTIIPVEDIYETTLSVHEAMSFVLSGGILSPDAILGMGLTRGNKDTPQTN